ncbi:MAG: polysaccharide deacetylase family protein [Bacteroidota bacterium]
MERFTETYTEIKKEVPFSARAVIRNLALTGLSFKNRLLGIEQFLTVPRVQFLYIHHSFKDELDQLRRLMYELSKHHTFISHSEAVNKVLTNTIDKPYISISSDDGFKNNLYAADILNEYNAKACFFINPGIIDEKNFKTISTHCRTKLEFPPVEFLTWDDVAQLQQQGHEIGGHTMYHDVMANMSDTQLESDLQNTYDILLSKCGTVKHFAFPYGRFFHFNEAGRKAVFKAGFTSCASAERGCHINSNQITANDRLCIRRDHVILDWNMQHILYFLANNVVKKSTMNNQFPY